MPAARIASSNSVNNECGRPMAFSVARCPYFGGRPAVHEAPDSRGLWSYGDRVPQRAAWPPRGARPHEIRSGHRRVTCHATATRVRLRSRVRRRDLTAAESCNAEVFARLPYRVPASSAVRRRGGARLWIRTASRCFFPRTARAGQLTPNKGRYGSRPRETVACGVDGGPLGGVSD